MTSPSLLQRCQSREELHAWISQHLHLRLPLKSVCPSHDSPLEYLWQAYREPAGDLVVWAPRGGGKTTLGAVATLLDVLHKPGCAVRILGGSLEQSLRMWEHLEPMAYEVAEGQICGRDRAKRLQFENGASAAVLTQSQRAVRGLRVQKLRCDEVELFKPDIWNAAQLATRSLSAGAVDAGDYPLPACDVRASIEALSTLHHPGGLMQDIVTRAEARGTRIIKWCLLDVLESCPADRECSACPLQPECRGLAKREDGGYFLIDDAINMKSRVSRAMWEAEMLCLRPSLTLAVFPEFQDELHIAESPAWAQEWQHLPPRSALAIDFGYAGMFVCLEIAYDDHGRVFVRDEHTCSRVTLPNILKELAARHWPSPHIVACDPAGHGSNSHTGTTDVNLVKANYRTVLTRRSFQTDGLEAIRNALCPAWGASTFCISPRCVTTIKSMRGYRYKHLGDEAPWKDGVHDHAMDALRYFYINRPLADCRVRSY